MATKADVNLSLNGETPQQSSLSIQQQEDIIRSSTVNDDTPGEYVVFKLVSSNRRGGVYIDGIDDVYNPATKKVERIRLLAGIDTIWQREQKDITPEYVKNNRRSLEFKRGVRLLQIPKWDTTMLEFARICRHNVGAPNRKTGSRSEFYEYNPMRQEQEELKNEVYGIEMAIKAKELKDEQAEKVAAFLGIRLVNDLGFKKTPDGIRAELMIAAKRDPKKFEGCIDSKEVEVQYMVRKAISDAKIDVGGASGNVLWGSGGTICRVPMGRNTIDYLTELALTNSDEGRAFLSQLQKVST